MTLHALDNIVRKVEKSEAVGKIKTKSSSEMILIVDKQKKIFLQNPPFLGGQNIAYYLISNTNNPSNFAHRKDLVFSVVDFVGSRELYISIDYRVTCPSVDSVGSNEKKVVFSLCGDDSPGNELDKKIKNWVAEFTNEQAGEFINDYSNQVQALQASLRRNALEQVGLDIKFRFSLRDEGKLEPVKIGPTEITVYVCDSDNALELQLQTELVIDDAAKAASNLAAGWLVLLVNQIKEEIKKYFLENVTINQFFYELKDTVRNGLVHHLNKLLGKKGRRVGYLSLDSQAISSTSVPRELVELQHSVECKVQRYAGLVTVENTLQMIPQDSRRYVSAQSPSLKAWAENKLEKIIKPLLLGKKYIDILLNFQAESNEIKRAMQIEAESIGYAIQHIVSLPKLEHSALRENLEIKDDSNKNFSTNAASIKVKLSTTANIKFDDLSKIENYLMKTDEKNQLVSRSVEEIKGLLREAIHSKTGEILRTIEPERFYMGFYVSTTEGKSVEVELTDAITSTLKERFGANIIRVVPVPEQTDIIDYLQRLMGIIGSFECEIPSLSGGEPVIFQGDFKILGIERGSWYTFQSAFQSMRESQQELLNELQALKSQHAEVVSLGDVEDSREELDEISHRIRSIEREIFGIDDIRKSIEKSINARLATADSQNLRYADINMLSSIEKYINKVARESVVEQYGLEIKIRNLYRNRTQQEERLFEARKQLEAERVDEALAQIEDKRKERENLQKMTSRRRQALLSELDKLYEQRSKFILDSDIDSEELSHLNSQIDRLEIEISVPSLERVGSELSLLEPKRDAKGSLSFESQMNLLPESIDLADDFDNNP